MVDLSVFNCTELLIMGCLILYHKQLDALGPGKLTGCWECRGDRLSEEETPGNRTGGDQLTHGETKESRGQGLLMRLVSEQPAMGYASLGTHTQSARQWSPGPQAGVPGQCLGGADI